MTLDEFFAGHEDSRPIFEVLRNAIEGLGSVETAHEEPDCLLPKKGVCLGVGT
jgi:hypothetical protein